MFKDEFVSASARVANQIRDMIFITHELKKGDKLANERDLALKLCTSRNTLREAIKTLVAEGLLVSRRGSGNYVMGRPQADQLSFEARESDKNLMKNWYEMRLIIEPQIAKLAVERATDKEIERIVHWGCVEIQKTQTVPEFVFADQQFHAAVAIATHNITIERLVPYIQESSYYGSALASAGHWFEKAKQQSVQYHEEISKAFLKRDPFGAYLSMQNHLMQGIADIEW